MIFVVGAGGHARVVLDAIRAVGQAHPVGFIDDNRKAGTMVDGLPVLGPIGEFAALARRTGCRTAVVAFGFNFMRLSVAERIASDFPEVVWMPLIHPSAVVSPTASIGAGAVVMAGCVVNPGAKVGAHAIVNTRTSIDHDTVLGEFASTGPGAVTGGNVSIGTASHLGIGAAVRHGIAIGRDSVIGAGSVVLDDIADNCVAYGSPARVVRSRLAQDKYL